MWRFSVYIHRKASTGEVFYVGKASRPDRATSRARRSPAWKNTVAKHGLVIETIASCIDDAEAQRLEMAMIADIGRRDLGIGPLVNLTDGGDGHTGIFVSEALRLKRRMNASAPRSQAWIAAIRVARKDGGNGGVVKTGDRLPAEWRAALAASKRGAKNPYFGKASAVAKKVINTATGAIYDSIARAAAAEGISAKTLYQYLDGARPNRTTLARL